MTQMQDGSDGDGGADAPSAGDGLPPPAEELVLTLDDLVLLLEQEIERLKAALETYRLLDHPRKLDIIRWHVRRLDERQDRLEALQAALRARRGLH